MDSDLRFRLSKSQIMVVLVLFLLGIGGWGVAELVKQGEKTLKARSDAAEAAMLEAIGEIPGALALRRDAFVPNGCADWYFSGSVDWHKPQHKLSFSVTRYVSAVSAKEAFGHRSMWSYGSIESVHELPGEEALFVNHEEERWIRIKQERAREQDEIDTQGGWITYRSGSRIVHVTSYRSSVPFSEVRRIAQAIEPFVKDFTPEGLASPGRGRRDVLRPIKADTGPRRPLL